MKIDLWWREVTHHRRIDRAPYYLCSNFGLFLTAVSMLLNGPIPNTSIANLPNETQIWMAILLFVGTGASLVGAITGCKIFFRHTQIRTSYTFGIAGTPSTISALLVYSWSVFASRGWDAVSAVGTTSSALICIAAFWNSFYMWLEIRRITFNIQKLREYD